MNRIITILLLFITHLPCLYAGEMGPQLESNFYADIKLIKSLNALDKQAGTNVVTVGLSTSRCDFNSIQAAINSIPTFNALDIRIASNKTYSENLVISNKDINLLGGYANCIEAAGPFAPTGESVLIDGGNDNPVIRVNGSALDMRLILTNLNLRNGLGRVLVAFPEFRAGGGILAQNATADILLNNIDIRDNEATAGAGIAIIGNATNIVLEKSVIANHSAQYGAGVYCSSTAPGSTPSIIMSKNSGVFGNVSIGEPIDEDDILGAGAGFFLKRCNLTAYSGSSDSNLVGINTNFAFGHGGGIYVDGGNVSFYGHKTCTGSSTSSCIGDDSNPVKMTSNLSGFTDSLGNGGGIYATNLSNIKMEHVLISDNQSDEYGGAIYLNNAHLTVRQNMKRCWDKSHCNHITGNSVRGTPSFKGMNPHGGAVYIKNSMAEIQHAVIENNHAKHGAAFAVHNVTPSAAHGPSQLRLFSSMIIANGDDDTESIFESHGRASWRISHSTIADNDFSTTFQGTFNLLTGNEEQSNPLFALESSIVDNFGINVLSHRFDDNDFEVDIKCVIANETSSMTSRNDLTNVAENEPGGAYISQDNPGFSDSSNGDYHLAPDSPAIDYCNNSSLPSFKDIDYQIRGIDDPNTDDISIESFFDIGADESYAHDIIFYSGFASDN